MLKRMHRLGIQISVALLITLPVQAAKEKKDMLIWQDEEQFVMLVHINPQSKVRNHHPESIDEQQLALMLAQIGIVKDQQRRFTFDGKRSELASPLFSDQEVETLANYFSVALAQAQPNQDIIFRSHGEKASLGGVVNMKTVNTGRAFWHDRQLHMIFGEVHGRSRARVVYGRLEPDTSKRNFGSRLESSDKIKVTIATTPGVSHHRLKNGRSRLDWITLDYAAIQLALQQSDQSEHSHQPTQQHHIQIEPTSKTPATETMSAHSAVNIETLKHRSVRDTLQDLKALYDEGLITQDVYERTMEQIIEQAY